MTFNLRKLDVEEIKRENPFTKLVQGQTIVEIPSLQLESGLTINNFPIAYKTWGTLNETVSYTHLDVYKRQPS